MPLLTMHGTAPDPTAAVSALTRVYRRAGLLVVLVLALTHLAAAQSAAVSNGAPPQPAMARFPAGRYAIVVRDADAHGPFVAGRWELHFGADGRTALRDPQGALLVEGTYAVHRDTLIITDVAGPLSCAQSPEVATAILTWAVAGPRLFLHTVDDPCGGRQQAFAALDASGFIRVPDATGPGTHAAPSASRP